MKESTRAVWAGRRAGQFGRLVNTPVCRGTTLLADSMADWRDMQRRQMADEFGASTYGRFGTPTHHALQEAAVQLEGGYRALLYPSGLAAISSTLLGLLAAGDHILVPDCSYSPTIQFLEQTLSRYGVQASRYDPCDLSAVKTGLRPETTVVFVQSPGSDTFEIQDIPAIAEIARAHGAWVVMDNTWATPLYFKPFEHGVDVSIQAATKYMAGHSDATLGIATCNEASWERVRSASHDLGQTTSPDDVYLTLRGLRTMPLRLRQHWQSGLAVAQWLEARPEVEAVLHPALASHPGHALWKRDFLGACGLFSVALKPVEPAALERFVDALSLFGLGLSWGGFESLVMPFPTNQRKVRSWPYEGTGLRLHVGLEDTADLLDDLAVGFEALRRTPLSAARVMA